jgi:hypothetical protein
MFQDSDDERFWALFFLCFCFVAGLQSLFSWEFIAFFAFSVIVFFFAFSTAFDS